MNDALYKYEDEIGRDEARAIDYALLVFDSAAEHPREAYENALVTQSRLRARLSAAESEVRRLRGVIDELRVITGKIRASGEEK
jgi:hypothetical protein